MTVELTNDERQPATSADQLSTQGGTPSEPVLVANADGGAGTF